jgi:hypothetical protein
LISKIRAARTLSIENVKSLLADYDTLGEDQFYVAVGHALNPPKAQKGRASSKPIQANDTLSKLKDMQGKTMAAKPFIQQIMAEATKQNITFRSRATPPSLPKLVEHFEQHATGDLLLSLAAVVYQANSRAHTSFRDGGEQAG